MYPHTATHTYARIHTHKHAHTHKTYGQWHQSVVTIFRPVAIQYGLRMHAIVGYMSGLYEKLINAHPHHHANTHTHTHERSLPPATIDIRELGIDVSTEPQGNGLLGK